MLTVDLVFARCNVVMLSLDVNTMLGGVRSLLIASCGILSLFNRPVGSLRRPKPKPQLNLWFIWP